MLLSVPQDAIATESNQKSLISCRLHVEYIAKITVFDGWAASQTAEGVPRRVAPFSRLVSGVLGNVIHSLPT